MKPQFSQESLAIYEEALTVIQAEPSARVVGSLGRMVACQQILGDPFLEFRMRTSRGYRSSASRRLPDIDLIGVTDEFTADLGEQFPHITFDNTSFNRKDISVKFNEKGWHLVSERMGINREITDRLMAPNVGKVGDVEIVTLPVVTQVQLHTVRNQIHLKDRIAQDLFGHLGVADLEELGSSEISTLRYAMQDPKVAPLIDEYRPLPSLARWSV
jgi:hypothetical protein